MMDFKAIAKESENKVHFVYNFLAVLEMLQQELIDIQVGLGYNNFWISAKVADLISFDKSSRVTCGFDGKGYQWSIVIAYNT
jgi:segregation and condensation protein A